MIRLSLFNCVTYWIVLLFIFLSLNLFPNQIVAAGYNAILKKLHPNTITIIGETHQRKESVQLFQSLVSDYLQQGKCLTVGLEIASDQQPVIDRIGQGRATAADIAIAPMIDHPAFRKMIDALAALQHNGACLKMIGIDAGDEIDVRRDQWMADRLAAAVGETPVLVLLGSLHTLKKVDWDLSMTKESPYVAEILNTLSYTVSAFPQAWADVACTDLRVYQSRFIPAESTEALVLLNGSLISLLNAFEFSSAVDVIDGYILWECKSPTRQ